MKKLKHIGTEKLKKKFDENHTHKPPHTQIKLNSTTLKLQQNSKELNVNLKTISIQKSNHFQQRILLSRTNHLKPGENSGNTNRNSLKTN